MKRIAITLTIVGLACPPLPAQQQTSPNKEHLLDGNCTVVKSKASLPEEIKTAFASATKEAKFSLADPGEPFQVTDVIEPGPHLPFGQLIFAGVCDGRWFVYYEHGGYGINYRLLVFSNEHPPKSFSGVVSLKKANTLDELRDGPASVKFGEATDLYR